MEFKVGDKVRAIKRETKGKKGTIVKTWNDGDGIEIAFEDWKHGWGENNCHYNMYVNEVELVKFTKSDLKDGDVVTYRNGNQRTLKGDILIDKEGFRIGTFKCYDDNLKHINVKENDIIKVERPVQYKTVFERKEEILDEAEKRYLRGVIRPFRKEVEHITKIQNEIGTYIHIELRKDAINFPYLKDKTMYKDMKTDKEYTLEELRTIKECENK